MAAARRRRRRDREEMTKWFDTNYHYIVPELRARVSFRHDLRGRCRGWRKDEEHGIKTKPVLIGALTFLLRASRTGEQIDRLELLDALVEVYAEVLAELGKLGRRWEPQDEPMQVEDRTAPELEALERAYKRLGEGRGRAPFVREHLPRPRRRSVSGADEAAGRRDRRSLPCAASRNRVRLSWG